MLPVIISPALTRPRNCNIWIVCEVDEACPSIEPIIIIIYPLTARLVGAPQMISQPVSSIFPCSLLPSGICELQACQFSDVCLPTSSSVCLVFFPLSLCLARWFLPDLTNWRYDHTIAHSSPNTG